jgi:hypothetical protein
VTEYDDGSKSEEDPLPRRKAVAVRVWPHVRVGLEVIGIAAEVRQNVALAAGTRAIVLVGDVVFQLGRR